MEKMIRKKTEGGIFSKMRRIYFGLLALFLVLISHQHIYAQQPDYAKYGRIATAVIKEDYPDHKVVEYEYLGREKVSDQEVKDSFKFEVMQNNRPTFVIVTIQHSLANNRLIQLTVKEQSS